MRIHTNVDESVIRNAAEIARVRFTRFSTHKSKTAKFGYEITLSGESRRRQNGGDDYAATWDQWGIFLSVIYESDPNAKCWAYRDAGDFDYKTNDRFRPLELGNQKFYRPSDNHGDHKWIVGIPYMQKCKKCSAVRRWN